MKKNFEKFIYIDACDITHIAESIYYDSRDPLCRIQSGEWDLQFISPIEDSVIYKSMYDMFVNSKQWGATQLYKIIEKPIINNTSDYLWNCSNIPLLNKRGEHLYKLYNSIKENGILKHELVKKPQDIFDDEIMIALDRNGRPLSVRNGNHRLAIAKILNVKNIPVKVYRRHELWENTRKSIFGLCDKLWHGKTYHPIPHPDFGEIKYIWSENRYNLFKQNTESKAGDKLLDIGSLFGYMCYRAERDGYNCTACEIDEKYLNVMEKLHDACCLKYNIIKKSFLDLESVEYDVIFAFNILHHFLKTQTHFDRLTSFLKRCKFKELYLQCHDVTESQMINAYKNFTPEEFAKFICESTGKQNYIFIGEESSRKIYKIF